MYVNQALGALERGQQCLHSMRTGETNGRRLASTFLGLPTMLTEQFAQQHPDLPVIESNELPDEVLTMLLNNHMDFALTLFPLEHPDVEQLISIREPLLLVLPPTINPPGDYVCLSDYETARFGVFEGGKELNQSILQCCSEAGFVPNIVYRTTRSQIVHQLVAQLNVCTLMPAHMVLSHWEDLTPETQARICLVDEPKCYRNLCLSRNRYSGVGSPEKEAFVEFAIQFIQRIDLDISTKLRSFNR